MTIVSNMSGYKKKKRERDGFLLLAILTLLSNPLLEKMLRILTYGIRLEDSRPLLSLFLW